MSLWNDHVLPRLIDRVLAVKRLQPLREQACVGLAGDVVEIGFGSGLNIPYYPAEVRRVWAVEPSALARRLAAERVAEHGAPVEFAGPDAQQLPFRDGTVDAVLSTWTLCTIPDAGAALREVARVLRPGGRLHFLEHGRAPDARVLRWQERLNPLQRRLAGGCHLQRPIVQLVTDAGLQVESLETGYVPGEPKPFSYLYEGVATRSR